MTDFEKQLVEILGKYKAEDELTTYQAIEQVIQLIETELIGEDFPEPEFEWQTLSLDGTEWVEEGQVIQVVTNVWDAYKKFFDKQRQKLGK